MPPQDPPGYPPGTPMHREAFEQGVFSKGTLDSKAQIKLEKHRRDLIDVLGRVASWTTPIENEARIRLIDMNVDLAAARSKAAKAAKQTSQASASGVPPEASAKKDKQKQQPTKKGKEKEDAESCDEQSDCSMPEDEFEATLTPYIKETLQSTLNNKVQSINAQCAAEGMAVPETESVVCRALAELRDKIEDGREEDDEDDERLVADIALRILDEFSIKHNAMPVRPKLEHAKLAKKTRE